MNFKHTSKLASCRNYVTITSARRDGTLMFISCDASVSEYELYINNWHEQYVTSITDHSISTKGERTLIPVLVSCISIQSFFQISENEPKFVIM